MIPAERHSATISKSIADCAGIAAFAVVGILWIIFAAEEPLHIDELRQAKAYSGGFERWVDVSWGMNQPPLEITLGALWRRAFGMSDYAERLFPVIVGLLSLILLARLAVRLAGTRTAAPIAILTYGLSPLVFRTTAFMRPYAIPTFFSLFFLTALIDLRDRGPSRFRTASALTSGIGLLLSHALIPLLVSSLAALGLFAMKLNKRPESSGTAPARRIAFGVALLGLLMPAALRIRNPVFFEASISYSLLERLTAAVQVVSTAVRSSLGWAVVPVVFSLILLIVPAFRPQKDEMWWFIALFGIPAGIAMVFFATVAPGYSYPDRYLHDFMLTGALAMALVGSRWATIDRDYRHRRWAEAAIALGLVGSYLFFAVPAFQHEVTTERTLDWREGADLIISSVDPGTLILFEPLVPFPSYQTLFYGQPRYLPASYRITMSRLVVGSDHDIGNGPMAVLLVGPDAATIAPAGWRSEQQGIWQLLIPPSDVADDTAAVLQQLETAITEDQYDVTLRMNLAIQLAERGDIDAAYSTLDAIERPTGVDPQQVFDTYRSEVRDRIALLQP